MQQTIIAKYHDGDDWNVLGIIIKSTDGKLESKSAVVEAFKAAAAEYAKTPDGKDVVDDNCGDFNYGDFVNSVPDEICEKHGFRVVDTFQTELIVDHDDCLVEEYD